MSVDTALTAAIDASDPLGEIFWSKTAHVQVQFETFFAKGGMTAQAKGGEEVFRRMAGAPIHLYDELGKAAGSEVRISLRRQLTSTPRNSAYTYGTTNVMTGNEEALVFYDCAVILSLLKHAAGYNSPDMYDHVSSINLGEQAKAALLDWLIENTEEAFLDGMYEKYPYFGQASSLLATQTAVAHPNQRYTGNATAQADMNATMTLNATEMMRLRSFARRLKIAPVKKDSTDGYVFLADTFVCSDLRQDPIFRELKDALPAGADNPIASGEVGSFQGMHVFEYERMRVAGSGANADNIGRCLLLGAGALAVAYGSRPRIVERTETFYDDRYGKAIRQVFGCTRTDFMQDSDATTMNQSSIQLNVWRATETYE